MKKTSFASLLLLLAASCGGPAAHTPLSPKLLLAADWEWWPRSLDMVSSLDGRVLGPEGEPVPGASVRVWVMPLMHFGSPLEIGATTAAADGAFRFEGLPANVWLQAEKPGFAGRAVSLESHLGEGHGALIVSLRPAGVLEGTVRMPDHLPVAQAVLSAFTPNLDWFRTVRTDDEGRFRMEDVPGGAFRLQLLPGTLLGGLEIRRFEPGEERHVELVAEPLPTAVGRVVDDATSEPVAGAIVRSLADREVAVLADDEGRFEIPGAHLGFLVFTAEGWAETAMEISPRDPGARWEARLKPGMSVSGRVVDRRGRPVPQARVEVVLREARRFVRGPLTDDAGRFHLSWLPEPKGKGGHKARLLASGPGLLTGSTKDLVLARGEENSGYEIVLPDPVEVSLRLVDETGAPWSGISFTLLPRRSGFAEEIAMRLPGESRRRSGADGRGRYRGAREGPWLVGVRIDDREPFELPVDLTAAVSQDLGDIVVPRGLEVSGRLLSDSGGAPADAVIQIGTGESSGFRRVPVRGDGAFRVFGLEEGEVRLQALAPMHEPENRTVPAGTTGLEIPLRSLGTVEVHLQRPSGVGAQALVEIARTGAHLPGRVPRTTELAPDESRALFPGLQKGEHRIRVLSDAWYGTGLVQVEGLDVRKVEVPLLKGGSVTGVVRDPEGLPLSRVAVTIGADEDWWSRTTVTDREGRYRFNAVPPGTVPLTTHPEGYRRAVETADVVAGETAVQDIAIRPGVRLDISVATPAGRPVSGLTVSIRNPKGELARSWVVGGGRLRTNAEGRLILTGIAGGEYTLTLLREGQVLYRAPLALAEGEPRSLQIELEE